MLDVTTAFPKKQLCSVNRKCRGYSLGGRNNSKVKYPTIYEKNNIKYYMRFESKILYEIYEIGVFSRLTVIFQCHVAVKVLKSGY